MDVIGKKALVFGGKTGLLGQALTTALAAAGAVPIPLSSQDADILDPLAAKRTVDEHAPDLMLNAAAYTQVDQAEDEQEQAFALNATAPPLLASIAAQREIPFVHFSTDFVFRGDSRTPYTVDETPDPYSVYGISKAEGERGLINLGYSKTLIIRIAWLFGPGRINFVERIISLCAERKELTVVDDQTGSPSYAPDVAANAIELLKKDACGVYHLTNSGTATWFELAQAAAELAGAPCSIAPVPTSAYPTKAKRPAYSVLDLSRFEETTGKAPRHWREALEEYVAEELGLPSRS